MERMWEPPGPGPWELESTHFQRPVCPTMRAAFASGLVRGFSEGTARYGLLLDHLAPGFVNDFLYMQPVPFGAPSGPAKPPPKAVLWLLLRLHPKLSARTRTAERAFADRLWRRDLAEWDEVDKPAAIAKHRAIQSIDVTALSGTELAKHVLECGEHVTAMVYQHHKYTVTALAATGDLLAGATGWTGASAGELLGLLRGTSAVSNGFAVEELDLAGKQIAASDTARDTLSSGSPARTVLAALRADPDAGEAVTTYLDTVRYRSVGYDVGDQNAGELPDMLVGVLKAAAAGSSAVADDGTTLAGIRARVPAQHQADFDDRLADARLVNRLRDERGVYSDGWATGLARRALLEAGARLTAQGKLAAADHAADLAPTECAALLRGRPGPSSEEVAERYAWRTTKTTADAPASVGAVPSPPPPTSLLPRAARRGALALDAMLGKPVRGLGAPEHADGAARPDRQLGLLRGHRASRPRGRRLRTDRAG
ncbi:MAG: hypothetical protein L0H79_08465 [Intrasporangium sp.]|uniref:hypothetical protein n=1 Tax=Intrasporangium sp. TaxID=1925024 RepID=UPI002649F1E5|nr:hypothetical protein [Intrasporangium sp.]MDN5795771.1 hypothetical protein [Intrasporangium sp.]